MKFISWPTMQWKSVLREEFALKNFRLEHDQPHLFVTSQCGSKFMYILWTIIAVLYHAVWIVMEPMLRYVNAHYFIYLTNQGYLLLTFTCMCQCASTMYVHWWRTDIMEGECRYLPWYLKAVWVMTNITNVMALIITVSFYTFIRKNMSAPLSIEKHAFNSIFVMLNICITAMPIRLYHVYQPICAGTVYVIFSYVYQAVGGSAIYTIIDWNNVKYAMLITCCIVLVLVPLTHLILYGVHRLRIFVASKVCHKDQDYTLNIIVEEEKAPKLPDLYVRRISASKA